MEELLIPITAIVSAAAGYFVRGLRRRKHKVEDRGAGLQRYQDYKDQK